MDYVADKLRSAGYRVTIQPFQFPFFEEQEPTTLSRTDLDPDKEYVNGTDFAIMEYSGSGTVEDTEQVGLLTYVLLRRLDDIAYGLGVWTGVVHERHLGALKPQIRKGCFAHTHTHTHASPS